MKKQIFTIAAILFSRSIYAQGTLNISSGSNIKPTGGAYVVFNNVNLVNNGILQQIAGGGTIEFAGNTDVSLSGTGTTSIDSLELSQSGSNLNLQSNISIASEVNFNGGLFNVGNNTVDLGSTGIFKNESETSRAYSAGTGYAQSTQTLNAPSSVNAGNLGAIITSSANLGSTVIQRGFTSNSNVPGGSSILRYYVITPTNDAGLNATYRFQYLNAELNGLNDSTLNFWKSPDNINWVDSGFTTRDTLNKYVEKTGINDFSSWTLAPNFTVLAVTMGPLSANTTNNNVIDVTWQIYTAVNVKTYDVQRSADGKTFTTIGELPVAGATNYTYPDDAPLIGNNFYRLQIINTDGSVTYSNIAKANISSSARSSITLYPNPVIDHTVTLQLTNAPQGIYQLVVFDNTGKDVYSSSINCTSSISTQVIYLPQNISTGIYKVQLKNAGTIYNQSLFVK